MGECSESDSKVYWRWGEGTIRDSSGPWPDGIEAPISLSKGLCKLKGQPVGKSGQSLQDGLEWLTGLIDKVL
jgi:hypothetical protein